MEGQGVAEDATFHDSNRDVAGMRTWRDKDRDAKAWQDEDKDRKARNWT
jgi:hypothetical protein